jgi:hypothetical protein
MSRIHSINIHNKTARFGLTTERVNKISNFAVTKLEPAMLAASALLVGTGLLTNSNSISSSLTNNQNPTQPQNSSLFNLITNPAFANIGLDLVGALGELGPGSRTLYFLGNIFRAGVNGLMCNTATMDFAQKLYLIGSGSIAIALSVDSHKHADIEQQQINGFWNKTKYQLNYFANYWRKEVPGKLKELFNSKNNLKRWNEFKHNPSEFVGNRSRHGLLMHAMLAFVSSAFLILGHFLAKPQPKPEDQVSEDKDKIMQRLSLVGENNVTKLGWRLAQASRVPLLISLLFGAFNSHRLKKYNRWGSRLSLLYAATVLFNNFAMLVSPKWAAGSDFLKNAASNLWALNMRLSRQNLKLN